MQQGKAPIVPIHEPRELTAEMSASCDIRQSPSKKPTHASIPAMGALIALSSECLGIAGLQIFSSGRLNIDHGVVDAAWRMRWTKSTVER